MDIQPGDLVVCVDASPNRFTGWACSLTEGRHYRVRGRSKDALDGVPGLFLFGAKACYEDEGYGFRADRFRKLNDGEDDAELIARIRACKPTRIPTLHPIQTLPVRLDPGVWPLLNIEEN